jgi:hypothetical protein
MNEFDRKWNRLTALARRAADADEVPVAPPGFAVHVVACWQARRDEEATGSVWGWLAVRGLAVACALMILAALVTWSSVETGQTEELAALADPLTSEALAP